MPKKLSLLASILFAVVSVGFCASKAHAQQNALFQTTISLSAPDHTSQHLTIPTGYRLVIDYINIDSYLTESDSSKKAQPYVDIVPTFNGRVSNDFYTLQVSPMDPTQFFFTQPTVLYADSLFVIIGWTGDQPQVFQLNLNITGHLVKITAR